MTEKVPHRDAEDQMAEDRVIIHEKDDEKSENFLWALYQ